MLRVFGWVVVWLVVICKIFDAGYEFAMSEDKEKAKSGQA